MGDEPEVWISDDSGTGPAPQQGPGHGPGSGRWIALIAGFAALLALIAVQHYAGGSRGDDTAPSPSVSVTPPPTSPTSSPPGTSTGQSSDEDTASRSPSRTSTGSRTSVPITSAAATAPVTVTTDSAPSLASGDWELVGFQWSGAVGGGSALVRYRPGTGVVVATSVPSLDSSGPFSFAVTADAAIIRPIDNVNGFVVLDGHPAAIASGELAQGGQTVLPTAAPERAWVPQLTSTGLGIDLVDTDGRATGMTLHLPGSLVGRSGGFGILGSDGAGYVLVRAVGGAYDVRPNELRLVTHGTVLAAGPTGYLVYECDEAARCSAAVVDRTTHRHTTLHGYAPAGSTQLGQSPGVISSDGRYAVVLDYSGGPQLSLVDLHSGKSTVIDTSLNSQAPVWGDASSVFAFTPGSSALLIAAAGGVGVVDPTTGSVTGTLPVPTLAALAIRPAS